MLLAGPYTASGIDLQEAGVRLASTRTERETDMAEHDVTATTGEDSGGLLVARRRLAVARSRAEQPSDGGSTGRSDGND